MLRGPGASSFDPINKPALSYSASNGTKVAITFVSAMTVAHFSLLLLLCSVLLVGCEPRPGTVPIYDFFFAQRAAEKDDKAGDFFVQKAARERDKAVDVVRFTEGPGTPVTIPYEAFDERAYMQQRFAGKKVVFPSELEANGIRARSAAYTIGPEDTLRIFVWQNPDLSGETVVRPDGRISLPLVGEVGASGLTVNALQQKLTEAYRAFVLNPQIAVIPLQLNSRRIFLLGQIAKTEELAKQGGLFLRGDGTLLENIAGIEFLPTADLAEAFVTRKDIIIPVNLERLIKGGDLSQNIVLQPGDTVVVPAATKDVMVLGAVRTPGRYNLKQRDNLLAALAIAGGPTENADLLQAYMTRDASVLPVNFKRLLADREASQNVLLKDKDFIYIPDVRDNRVYVLGEVVRPGAVPFREDLHVIAALAQVGDITDRGQPSWVYVVRGDLRQQPQVIQVDVQQMVRGRQRPFPLRRDDIVFVTRSALGSWNRFVTLLMPSFQAALTAATLAIAVR